MDRLTDEEKAELNKRLIDATITSIKDISSAGLKKNKKGLETILANYVVMLKYKVDGDTKYHRSLCTSNIDLMLRYTSTASNKSSTPSRTSQTSGMHTTKSFMVKVYDFIERKVKTITLKNWELDPAGPILRIIAPDNLDLIGIILNMCLNTSK